jgi:hypothetical protein
MYLHAAQQQQKKNPKNRKKPQLEKLKKWKGVNFSFMSFSHLIKFVLAENWILTKGYKFSIWENK